MCACLWCLAEALWGLLQKARQRLTTTGFKRAQYIERVVSGDEIARRHWFENHDSRGLPLSPRERAPPPSRAPPGFSELSVLVVLARLSSVSGGDELGCWF